MKITLKELQEIETEMLKEVSEICERNNITYYLAYGSALGAVRHKGPIPWDSDVDIIIPYYQLNLFISILRSELSAKYFVDYYDINKLYPCLFPRIGLKGFSSYVLHIDVFLSIGIPDNEDQQVKIINRLIRLNKMHSVRTMTTKYSGNWTTKGKLWYFIYKNLYRTKNICKIRREFDELCVKYPLENSEYVTNACGGYGLKEIIKKSLYGNGIPMKYENRELLIPENYKNYLQHMYGDYMTLPAENQRNVKDYYKIIPLVLK